MIWRLLFLNIWKVPVLWNINSMHMMILNLSYFVHIFIFIFIICRFIHLKLLRWDCSPPLLHQSLTFVSSSHYIINCKFKLTQVNFESLTHPDNILQVNDPVFGTCAFAFALSTHLHQIHWSSAANKIHSFLQLHLIAVW